MNIFEIAARNKIRFSTVRGTISTEDLFDLPMTVGAVSLDSIAKELHEELNKSNFSLVTTEKKDEILETKFQIVKYVFNLKTEELAATAEEKERAEKRALLMDAIESKEVEELIDGKSVKELRKELKKMA